MYKALFRRNPFFNQAIKENKMEIIKDVIRFWTLLILCFCFTIFIGCDSGKKTIDQVTGNEAVKQFEKSKEKIDDITDSQNEKLNSLEDDESYDDSDDLFSGEEEE